LRAELREKKIIPNLVVILIDLILPIKSMSYRGILSPIGSPHNENVTFSDSDVILTDSPPPDSHLHNFTCSKIRILLETKPEQYIIIKKYGQAYI
ncbi:unnamed protein product, partial [Rotaria magnacalcarata]